MKIQHYLVASNLKNPILDKLDINGNIVRNATRNLSCTVPNLNLSTTYFYSLTSYDKNKQALTISNGNFATSTAGIVETGHAPSLQVYPNPVSESFRIGGITENTLLKIADITGKIVWQQAINADEAVWVTHLQSGIYFVNVKGQTLKIIKRY